MTARTRANRPTAASPRYTRRHGIGQDRMRWPASLGTFRHADQQTTARTDPTPEPSADGSGMGR